MKIRALELLVLMILPALATAEQNHNCRVVFKGHGVTQLDCAGNGKINTLVIAGLDKEMGDTHVFIGKSIDQAKEINKRFHSPNNPKCFDYFRTTGTPVGDALSRQMDEKPLPWDFRKALAGLRK